MPLEAVFFLDSKARSLIIWCPLIVYLLCNTGGAQGALTTGEIAALEQLFANFPILAVAHRRIIEFPTGEYFGKAWTTNFTAYCDHGEGYGFNGVYCHDGHISGINVNQQWETQISTNYSLISGLQYLTNITTTGYSNGELLIAVIQVLPLKYIKGGSQSLTDTAFAYPEEILSFEGVVSSTFNISSFTNLQILYIDEFPEPSAVDTWIWPYGTLVSLQFGQTRIDANHLPVAWWLEHYPLFPALRVLRGIWHAGSSGATIPAVVESQTLQNLEIVIRDSLTPINLTIICSTCLELKLSWSTSTVNISAPSLRILNLGSPASWPIIDTALPFLKELSVFTLGRNDPQAFPNLDFAPSLTSFQWSYSLMDHANLVRVLCSLPSTLQTLYLTGISSSDQQKQFPACLSRSTLTSVTLSETMQPGLSYNATALFLNLPSTLTSLSLSFIFTEPVPFEKLMKFTHLRSLIINDLNLQGEMSDDFLSNFPQLSMFSCRGSMTGTIPSTGWSSLETFSLDAHVTSWESIDSAPNLKRLAISSPQLARMPSNDQFVDANLQSLVYLDITNTQVSRLAPTFWNSLPKIEEVHLSNNRFSGPFNSSITSTSLILADFSNNEMCGPLPEVPVSLKPDVMRFHGNQFSGTIPDSWLANLSCITELTFQDNPINGTVSHELLENSYYFDLSDTNLEGPLWNMSKNPPLRVTILNSAIDICLVDPAFPPGKLTFCFFSNVVSCPQDCPSFWPCTNTAPCNRMNFTAREVGECLLPAPYPTPFVPVQCPPPPPPGFICVGGQYISNGSVTLVEVTLPPEAGVIVVKGNLSINGALTFSGLGSTIEVEGCIELPPSEIHIVLTSSDPLPPTTLINQKGSNCSNDLSKIPVIVEERKDSCKRTQLSTSDSTRATLVVAFTIDSSRCNVKWIILGSVLGGVLILSVIAVALLHVFSPSFRKFFRNGCRCKK